MSEQSNNAFALGWEEWLAMPELGIPAIKVKVDTGAQTSAIHARAIELFGSQERPRVRFVLEPDPSDPSLVVTCSADVVDQREIKSSNGESEFRFVIRTTARMGEREWPIEVTLTNRENMAYRMLLGRGAIEPDMVVVPTEAFQQPVLDYGLYKSFPRLKQGHQRPLRIALLTREPESYSSRRLIEAGEARGHVVEAIDTLRCYMTINALNPDVHYDGRSLPRYDAVIPRIGASITDYGMAIVRQFEMMGAVCLSTADAIGASRDKLAAHQRLARHSIHMPSTAFASSPKDTGDLIDLVGKAPLVVKLLQSSQGKGVVLAETSKAASSLIDAFRGLDANFLVQQFIAEAGGADVRAFVVGKKVVGAIKRQAAEGEFRSNLHRGGTASAVKLSRDERRIAVAAARAMGLQVAGVDLLQTNEGPMVLEVNSSPGLQGIEEATGKDVADLMIAHIETLVPNITRTRRNG